MWHRDTRAGAVEFWYHWRNAEANDETATLKRFFFLILPWCIRLPVHTLNGTSRHGLARPAITRSTETEFDDIVVIIGHNGRTLSIKSFRGLSVFVTYFCHSLVGISVTGVLKRTLISRWVSLKCVLSVMFPTEWGGSVRRCYQGVDVATHWTAQSHLLRVRGCHWCGPGRVHWSMGCVVVCFNFNMDSSQNN